jgi:hypothetical protein
MAVLRVSLDGKEWWSVMCYTLQVTYKIRLFIVVLPYLNLIWTAPNRIAQSACKYAWDYEKNDTSHYGSYYKKSGFISCEFSV